MERVTDRAEYVGMVTPTELRNLAEALENANHAAEQTAKLFHEAPAWKRAATALMPFKPEDNPKDGPCCYDLEYCDTAMRWIGHGCTCGNYDDAQTAARWAQDVNRWLDAQDVLIREGLIQS